MRTPLSKRLDIDVHNMAYAAELLDAYREDPNSVPDDWREWFGQLPHANGDADGFASLAPPISTSSIFNPTGAAVEVNGTHAAKPEKAGGASADALLQHCVDRMITGFRAYGHLHARLDPLGLTTTPAPPLSPDQFDIKDSDLDRSVYVDRDGQTVQTTVRELFERMQRVYCGDVGVQLQHIDDHVVRRWLIEQMEGDDRITALDRDTQRRILQKLTEAMVFEEFVRKKYLGAKTFSLEGSETLIPLLDLAIHGFAEQGVRELVLAMPHRGRLSVLANVIRQPPREIFSQFEDADPQRHIGGGDVKYHMGASGDYVAATGERVHVSLCFNPSHLEYVDPVALGRMRAKQDRRGDTERQLGAVVLIHGDAAFAGEGVVQETLNLSQLTGYCTGGTLHVIVNNQLGFTTQPTDSRSTIYATDVARMLQSPIFHVNGENPAAVSQVVSLALEFRRTHQRDVVIDMYCFRRFGHNETDEPSFTQPLLYQAIEHHRSIRDRFLDNLVELGQFEVQEADEMLTRHHDFLQTEYEIGKDLVVEDRKPQNSWEGYFGGPQPPIGQDDPDTGVPMAKLSKTLVKLTEIPKGFHLHRKLTRQMEARREMADGKRPLDWASAEALAFASLSMAGRRVRLSGQDAQRGTFSQRHGVLHDVVTGRSHCIFSKLSNDQAPVELVNSPLSEAGVLGFDYGYSLDYPEALVAWEAQFGDFGNCAQVIVDEFISGAEDKWNRLSGIIMLLPHGYEGQGPEHSSGRLERFLAIGAEDNIQVAYPSTPAQYFHLLRRQTLRKWRKPLVIFTPKSLLRHPSAVSSLTDLADGEFQNILPDVTVDPSKVRRIMLCTGKIYYELDAYRHEHQIDDIAIIRIEKLHPLRDGEVVDALSEYPTDCRVTWVQEEPINMGAWPHWATRFSGHRIGEHELHVVGRPRSASPATGSKSAHLWEQADLLERAFAD
ncbi:2-oxoglutarate dehydrogenase E1 component [Blastopirellula marina]|nr:2-oxoglutarate dehydrogenase E1 component [Blastopirellula marina]